MEIVISNIKKGKTLKNTVPVTYFEKVLYNLKTKTEKSIENQKNNDQGRGVPVPKERVRDKHEQERFNWEYTCSECGGPVTAWDEECKNCNVWFRWNYVELPCQKK